MNSTLGGKRNNVVKFWSTLYVTTCHYCNNFTDLIQLFYHQPATLSGPTTYKTYINRSQLPTCYCTTRLGNDRIRRPASVRLCSNARYLRQGRYVMPGVCLSVCLTVSKFAEKTTERIFVKILPQMYM